MQNINTIEDLLDTVLGIHGHEFSLRSADIQILNSFYRQIGNGVALTERQFALLKLKLEIYTSQFKEQEIDGWAGALTTSRDSLREIDRSKYIKLVKKDSISSINREYKKLKDGIYIKVRFPFNKKHIVKLSECTHFARGNEYFHEKNSHEHYFYCTPGIAYMLVKRFPTWNIDKDLVDMHKDVEHVIKNNESFIPSYVNGGFVNIAKSTLALINKETFDNEYMIADKSIRYGYTYHTETDEDNLKSVISSRIEPTILADVAKFDLDEVVQTIHELDRYPLIVCIDADNSYNQVQSFYTEFSKFISDKHQSILFRVETADKENAPLNTFIKDNNLNNWVDNTTKVVYINKSKLPKVLLSSNFTPTTALSNTSLRPNRLVTDYIGFNCDLIVYNDETLSNFQPRRGNKWQAVN